MIMYKVCVFGKDWKSKMVAGNIVSRMDTKTETIKAPNMTRVFHGYLWVFLFVFFVDRIIQDVTKWSL
jgi:hypothetical protein